MPKMTIAQMKAMMPSRPKQLDALNVFVGRWAFSGEVHIAGIEEAIPMTGTSESTWDASRWFLVGDSVMSMRGFDDSRGHETWTYDRHDQKFRSTWVDSMGSVGEGSATFDEDSQTWTMKAVSHGAFGKSTAKGFVRLVDADTFELRWSEFALGGLMKTMEMCGTSKRRK